MSIDKKGVMERLEDDAELYQEICDIYCSDAPAILEKLKASVGQRDVAAAIRWAHSLKSASANVGATALSILAQQAEVAGKAGDLDAVSDLLARIAQTLAEVLSEIDRS